MAKNTVTEARGEIPVKRVLISVSDKSELEGLVRGLLEHSPNVMIYSSGGTYSRIADFLGDTAADHLMTVAELTGEPEMQGGLVKTLTPMIHGAILGERFNVAHQQYLIDRATDFFDLVVVNLYPFEEVISRPGCTYETARANIDIGGPTMIRGAAKNWLGCAVVCESSSYQDLLLNISENEGCTTPEMRFVLKQIAFSQSRRYERAIDDYMISQTFEEVAQEYTFV